MSFSDKVILGVVILIIGSIGYIMMTQPPIVAENGSTYSTTTPEFIEEQAEYDEEWLREAEALKERHLEYRRLKAERENVQSAIDELRAKYNDLDKQILEFEVERQSY
jgi:transcriptional regulator of heat shock response